ncbi:MAG: ABC transporter substrate-binding protein, partial [bacterium]
VYLPTTLAAQLGHYRDEGLNVRIDSFAGGARSLQALLGGSADVVSGFYDHTIQMAAEGRRLRAFVTMLRYPGFVLASPTIARIEDLRGAVVGVTAPGSSTHFFLNHLLSTRGLAPGDVSVTSIGGAATAVVAVERGKVGAAVMTDPAFTLLQRRLPSVRLLADARTAAGVRSIFDSDTYPAAVLYSTHEWLDRHPDAARRLARALCRTLEWIQRHSPAEIAARMPPTHRGDDAEIYTAALAAALPMFSPDGRMPDGGPAAVRRVLAVSSEKVRSARIDLDHTFTNDLVAAVADARPRR